MITNYEEQKKEELRLYLRHHKAETRRTYKQIASLAGINYQTLRNFLGGKPLSKAKRNILRKYLAIPEE